MKRKSFLRSACLLIMLVMLIGFSLPVFAEVQISAETQMHWVIRAYTDRDYKRLDGSRINGRQLWSGLGQVEESGYSSLTEDARQKFIYDVIAAAYKAIEEDSVQIGHFRYGTKDVTVDTATGWLEAIKTSGDAGARLFALFHSDTKPEFKPPVDSNRTWLLIVAAVGFILICIFLPKKPFSLPHFSNKQGSVDRLP